MNILAEVPQPRVPKGQRRIKRINSRINVSRPEIVVLYEEWDGEQWIEGTEVKPYAQWRREVVALQAGRGLGQ